MVWIILLPVFGALIGWWTNRLAIWMLFHPYRPVKLLWIAWQGVIPRKRETLAEKLAIALEENLLTLEDQQALLDSIEIGEHIDRIVTQLLDKQIPKTIFQKLPAMELMREKLIDTLRTQILRHMPDKLSDVDSHLLERVAQQMDIAGHIRQRMLELPMEELESLVRTVVKKEFFAIEIAGAGIGFAIGMLQAGLVVLW